MLPSATSRVFAGVTAAQLAATLSTNLSSKWGIRQVNQAFQDHGAFDETATASITVLTTTDYGSAEDVRKIIDGEFYGLGRNVINSTIYVMQPGAANPDLPPQPPQPFDLAQFLSDNWMWIALGVGGVVVAREIL